MNSLLQDTQVLELAQDDDLFAALRGARSRSAFEQLFERYHKAAFNLALHITTRPELAEESVQNAFSSLWTVRQPCQPGKFRSWFLCLVANACRKVLRSQRQWRRREIMGIDGTAEPAAGEKRPDQSLEHTELLESLRNHLSRLPETSRALVMLYFGAGLTQEEIGRELSMPTRTVSYKLDEALQQLRGRMVASGFAAAAPGITSASLWNDLLTGADVPPGMKERVIQKILSLSNHSQRLFSAAPKCKALLPLWLGAGAITLALACLCLAPGAGTQPTGASPASSSPPAENKGATAPVATERLHFNWSFASGPVKDLPVFQGSWAWELKPGGGAMVTPRINEPNMTGIVFPCHVPARPFVLRASIECPFGKGKMGFTPLYADSRAVLACRYWTRHFEVGANVSKFQTYFINQYAIQFVDHHPTMLIRFSKPYPADRLALLIGNCIVRDLELSEPNEADLKILGGGLQQNFERLFEGQGSSGQWPEQPFDWSLIPEMYRR